MNKLNLFSAFCVGFSLLATSAAHAATDYSMKVQKMGLVVQTIAAPAAPAQPVQPTPPPPPPPPPVEPGITVQLASYGANQGAQGNATTAVASVCNKKTSCTFDPYRLIGDPYPNKVKDLRVNYTCGSTAKTYYYNANEAGLKNHTLTCS